MHLIKIVLAFVWTQHLSTSYMAWLGYNVQQEVCCYLLVQKAVHAQTSLNELNVHIIQAVGRINVETVLDVPFP